MRDVLNVPAGAIDQFERSEIGRIETRASVFGTNSIVGYG